MILGIQILGILFALLMVYVTFMNRKKRELTKGEYMFWVLVWVVFLLLALFPTSLDFLIKDILDFSRRMDFFIVAGFMFLTGVVFHAHLIAMRTQKKTEKIVRNLAMVNYKKK